MKELKMIKASERRLQYEYEEAEEDEIIKELLLQP
jgi:hypothetical protein